MEFIAVAEMLVSVDPETRRHATSDLLDESPFVCTVRIEDDRGDVHSHTISGWWYPENQ
jgi:hypothetical protein